MGCSALSKRYWNAPSIILASRRPSNASVSNSGLTMFPTISADYWSPRGGPGRLPRPVGLLAPRGGPQRTRARLPPSSRSPTPRRGPLAPPERLPRPAGLQRPEAGLRGREHGCHRPISFRRQERAGSTADFWGKRPWGVFRSLYLLYPTEDIKRNFFRCVFYWEQTVR